MLSVIITSFKDCKIIDVSVSQIIDQLNNALEYEIIIIDDNSNDGTLEKIKALSISNPNVHIYLNPMEKGFGNSIKEGIKRAKGEFVCIVEAAESVTAQFQLSHVLGTLLQELAPTQAAKLGAQICGVRKKEAYELALQLAQQAQSS